MWAVVSTAPNCALYNNSWHDIGSVWRFSFFLFLGYVRMACLMARSSLAGAGDGHGRKSEPPGGLRHSDQEICLLSAASAPASLGRTR
jgi:hypothetical protein